MANIFLTNKCPRHCEFCFARTGPWDATYHPRPLTAAEIAEILDAPSSDASLIRGVVGGEPLLYRDFLGFLREMWSRELVPKVFTSGTCKLNEALLALPDEKPLTFVVNIARWETYTPNEQERLDVFLHRFHARSCLGYTLLDPTVAGDFLLDYQQNYRLQPRIRIGMAMPIADGGNAYLDPSRYHEAAQWVLQLAANAYTQHVVIGMDCGFVACMFTAAEIGQLQRWGVDITFACEPAVDIGPQLEAWHCFPLARLPRVRLRDTDGTLQGTRARLRQIADNVRAQYGSGIYADCGGCRYRRRGQCRGGCLAVMLNTASAIAR